MKNNSANGIATILNARHPSKDRATPRMVTTSPY